MPDLGKHKPEDFKRLKVYCCVYTMMYKLRSRQDFEGEYEEDMN